jgi:Uncharacterized conserved protein
MRQLIAAAINKPASFPHLSQVAYPGDKVVIAADIFVVTRPKLLADFVSEIIAVGISPADVTVLMLEAEQKMYEKPFRDALSVELREQVCVSVHKPLGPQCLAMLAVAKNDSPIMLNRELVEADVVIPIERYEAAPGMGYFGMQSVIYPRFADDETQKRFLFSETKKNREKVQAELVVEVLETAYSLGVMMTIQILADFQDKITRIIVGETKEIAAHLAKKRI